MDSQEFRRRGREMVEYICQYLETLEDRKVTPSVEPGYLRHLLPDEAPFHGENWDSIMEDVESKIMPGVTHWQHPRFHAYFPSGNSFPSILGDMLGDGIGCIGFSWAASPACTELETIVLDWLGEYECYCFNYSMWNMKHTSSMKSRYKIHAETHLFLLFYCYHRTRYRLT